MDRIEDYLQCRKIPSLLCPGNSRCDQEGGSRKEQTHCAFIASPSPGRRPRSVFFCQRRRCHGSTDQEDLERNPNRQPCRVEQGAGSGTGKGRCRAREAFLLPALSHGAITLRYFRKRWSLPRARWLHAKIKGDPI